MVRISLDPKKNGVFHQNPPGGLIQGGPPFLPCQEEWSNSNSRSEAEGSEVEQNEGEAQTVEQIISTYKLETRH